jgi:hypothetical protein
MAYNDFLHCYGCGAKVLLWNSWDFLGCAHCPGDHERAHDGAVAVHCPACTAAAGLLKPPPPGLRVRAKDSASEKWRSTWTELGGDRVRARYGGLELRRSWEPDHVVLTSGNRRNGLRVPDRAWEWLRSQLLSAMIDAGGGRDA